MKLVPLLLVLLLSSAAHGAPSFRRVFAFGDSWVDDNGVEGTWKHGAAPPSPPNAYRYSNGPTWPYYLAKKVVPDFESICDVSTVNSAAGLVGGNCSAYLNFAMGGACSHYWSLFNDNEEAISVCSYTNNATVDVFSNPLIPTQVDMCLSHPRVAAQPLSDQDLIAISVAGNDINMLFGAGGGFSDQVSNILDKPKKIADSIFEAIEMFFDAGARNFLLLNVPDMLVTPRAKKQAPKGSAKFEVADEVLEGYTEDFNNMVEDARFDFDGATFYVGNLRGCLRELDVGRYSGWKGIGFDVVDEACVDDRENPTSKVCDDPSTYAFFDDIHPTTALHEYFADQIYSILDGDDSVCFASPCFGDSIWDGCFNQEWETAVLWIGIVLAFILVGFLIFLCCVRCNAKVRKNVLAFKPCACLICVVPKSKRGDAEDSTSSSEELSDREKAEAKSGAAESSSSSSSSSSHDASSASSSSSSSSNDASSSSSSNDAS